MDDAKCGTKSCQATAEVTVFWPGQTLNMCRPCAMRAKQLASAMGLDLEVRAPIVVVVVPSESA